MYKSHPYDDPNRFFSCGHLGCIERTSYAAMRSVIRGKEQYFRWLYHTSADFRFFL